MRSALPLLLAAGVAACGEEGDKEANAASPDMSVAMQSEDVVAAGRPVLNIACANGSGSFWLELVRAPAEPPGPRGTFGAIKVDDGAPVRVELTWLGGDRWAPRLDHLAEAGLVSAMLRGRNVYFSGPEGQTDRAYRWDLARIEAAAAEELRAACG